MPFRDDLHNVHPYKAQPPLEQLREQFGLEQLVKLASNEGAWGPVPAAARAVVQALPDLNRYPDSAGTALRDALSEWHKIKPAQIVLGNGADELIRLAGLATLSPGTNGVMSWPSFPTYLTACTVMGAQPRKAPARDDWSVDLAALGAAVDGTTRVVFIANPNNPTATLSARDELRALINGLPDHVLVVLDEAYAEYAAGDDEPEGIQLVREGHERLLVLRTFSKVYGLAGLRIGYGVGSRAVIAALDKVRNIFNVNRVAQEAALVSLAAQPEVERRVQHAIGARQQIFKWLALAGHHPVVSRGNFVFAEAADGNGVALADRLLAEGVAIRPLDGFGAPQAIRVTVGSDEENEFFAAALDRAAAK